MHHGGGGVLLAEQICRLGFIGPEFDDELASIYKGLARKNMEVGSFANAEMQWRKILDITKDKTEPGHTWELIYCLERQSNLKEALSFLHMILDRSIKDENLKEQYSVQDIWPVCTSSNMITN